MSDDAPPRKLLPKPVDFDELYPGRFMKAGEFKGQKLTMKISAVDREILEGDRGEKEKVVLSFEKTDKQFVANKTNGICLRELFGKSPQLWVGKRVTLYPTVIDSGAFKGKDCIRVWGSPDIERDLEITLKLPRKRPIVMLMHKTLPNKAAASAAAPTERQGASTAAVPVQAEMLAKVSGATTPGDLADIRKTIWALYAAAKVDVPIQVEMAANDRRLTLEGE